MTRSGIVILSVLLLAGHTDYAYPQEDLNVISGKWLDHSDASNSLYRHLAGIAYKFLDRRDSVISSVKSAGDWEERQKFIRDKLHEIAGPFPEKTPLNAKTVRSLDRGSFRVEHVIYESQPRFYVTSSLFIPSGLKRGQRAPAIIYCSGHSAEGYRSAVYQHVILNLVSKGFIVFAFDPVGQGERLEYFDPTAGKSTVGGPTMEHSYPGAQALLSGSTQAMYMIWDGIRAVDYLLTRKEVDPKRIGITGRSGGGTQSAYIAAFDERIVASAPENYITSYRRLLQTIGPQDAEQNLPAILHHGLDHADFLVVRAPRPCLMITTTNDMFSIQGAKETEREVAAAYSALGFPERFARVEDVAGHTSTRKNREAMYAFFQKSLENPGNPADEETKPLSPEELKVTSTGQVSTSLAGETVFSLNRKRSERLMVELEITRRDSLAFRTGVLHHAKILSGYMEPAVPDEPVLTGIVMREGYVIEKYFIKGEGSYPVPYLLFRPLSKPGSVIIYIHPSGKKADADPGGEIEKLVRQGVMVLSPDLIGTGETGPGILKGDAYFRGVSHNLWYAAMICGRSIAGIRAGDVTRLALVMKHNYGDPVIKGLAVGDMCSVLLHAAALSNLFSEVILEGSCTGYNSIVNEKFYDPAAILNTVPGALKRYDLYDLEKVLNIRSRNIQH